MQPEIISAILTGVAGLITAISGFYALRRKRDEDDSTANYRELLSLRKESEKLRRKEVLLLRWNHAMQVSAAQQGVDFPPMPDELDRLLNASTESGPMPAAGAN